ncbi:5618_t:CDS:1, partial [Cetraspora pellucida]
MRLFSLLAFLFVFASAGTAQLSTYSLNFYSLNTTTNRTCTYQQSGYTLCANDPTTTITQITMPTSYTAKAVTKFIIITETILEPNVDATNTMKRATGTTSNTVLTTNMAVGTTNVAREQNKTLTVRIVTETTLKTEQAMYMTTGNILNTSATNIITGITGTTSVINTKMDTKKTLTTGTTLNAAQTIIVTTKIT